MTEFAKGETLKVRYATNSANGTGEATETIVVASVEGDYITATNGYRYHRKTVIARSGPPEPVSALTKEELVDYITEEEHRSIQKLKNDVMNPFKPLESGVMFRDRRSSAKRSE